MKFENTEVMGFKRAMHGMRNPKKSYHKNDTVEWTDDEGYHVDIGPNDLKLAQTLIRAGSEHRKFMRQIFVSVDITAPIYWWKEFDTYKVATVRNSTSTMHTLANESITTDLFEVDDYEPLLRIEVGMYHKNGVNWHVNEYLQFCDALRTTYLETKDKKYWKELIRWLPSGFLQTATITMNYENLLGMCSKGQRRFHKLNEWSGQDKPDVPNFIAWARSLPYAQELLFGDELDEEQTVTEEKSGNKVADLVDSTIDRLIHLEEIYTSKVDAYWKSINGIGDISNETTMEMAYISSLIDTNSNKLLRMKRGKFNNLTEIESSLDELEAKIGSFGLNTK